MTTWHEVTFAIESQGAKELIIEDNRAYVILDPLRWRILEILEAGKSVTEISEALDVTDARVLYHIQRLEETGVVRLEGDGAEDTRKWRCLPTAGVIRVRAEHEGRNGDDSFGPGDDRDTGDGQGTEGSPATGDSQPGEAIPADVAGQFNQAFREAAEGMYGPSFQVSINHNRARLSEVQAAEFNHRLLALIEEYFPPGKGDRSGVKYGFYGVFTPIDLHPFGDP
ncbi:MAG: winged helix-turn-helix transcriptional regulator [Gemmatimonadetes bacterium]|nr:winged helix-turn-helix transcriptional regulator [Gemmatimonadota bacterium]MYG85456.1 winged helix-turn-helix transcriptional regulator [Gemmatimonadota bacterium]MYJ90803.1 winged helix-turn-helix transcriptional regulator [Gemmatimonadota bacterium]